MRSDRGVEAAATAGGTGLVATVEILTSRNGATRASADATLAAEAEADALSLASDC